MKCRVAVEPVDQPEAIALIKELDGVLEPLYPPESRHGFKLEALRAPHIVFTLARDEQGVAHGCGAVALFDGFAELKRMYVRPGARGNGIGAGIVQALERLAAERGYSTIRLETGIRQLEALSFYEGLGYARRGPFAAYRPDPLSVFMEKQLATGKESQ